MAWNRPVGNGLLNSPHLSYIFCFVQSRVDYSLFTSGSFLVLLVYVDDMTLLVTLLLSLKTRLFCIILSKLRIRVYFNIFLVRR